MVDKNKLKVQFDKIAENYDKSRPGYPDEFIEQIIDHFNLSDSTIALEIGCGTGLATKEFAKLGMAIHCLDIGSKLLSIAESNLQEYTNITFENCSFEDSNIASNQYDFVFSAQAIHWIDESIRYKKLADIVKPNGGLALMWNITSFSDQDIREKLDKIYQTSSEHAKEDRTKYVEIQNESEKAYDDLSKDSNFKNLERIILNWPRNYNADEYINLLNSYSDHSRMEENKRTILYGRIRALIEDNNNILPFEYKSVAVLANRN